MVILYHYTVGASKDCSCSLSCSCLVASFQVVERRSLLQVETVFRHEVNEMSRSRQVNVVPEAQRGKNVTLSDIYPIKLLVA